MATESVIEILRLNLDLHGRELGLAEQLATIDRVIGMSTDEKDQPHYRSLRAHTHRMSGNTASARDALLEDIKHFQDKAP